jgi:hypothetical protein
MGHMISRTELEEAEELDFSVGKNSITGCRQEIVAIA